MTAIDPDTRDAAVAAYVAGATLLEAAEDAGVSFSSVQRWVAKAVRDNPDLLATRATPHDVAPSVYEGGWVVTGLVSRPLVNHRTIPPTQGDTAA